ncbi:hypothetical protein GCM10023189_57330 [Nibrella saemangeumensis]|uniref:Uncharacterized protein n=1 Tax=Nibrella saemangeumensis TaxID=1084526 RepID=A0ABP8NRD5_9BACT
MNHLSSTLLILLISISLGHWQPASLTRIMPVMDKPAPVNGLAQDTVKQKGLTRLFKSEDILQLTVRANLSSVLKDRGETPSYHPATLSYQDTRQESVTLPIKIMARGNFRRKAMNCRFPPLWLNFPKKIPKGNLFDKQGKLKLVTHCQNEEYVVREYMVYKVLNQLTDYSFRARLAKVTYEDSLGKRSPETRYAILLEDETDLAKRNSAKILDKKQLNMARVDLKTMLRVAVFEYLIGNTDWSVPYLHNIKLLTDEAHKQPVPVPYDFDHSGIVEAPYARPAEELQLSSVRQRLYRGYHYAPESFQEVFDEFNRAKPDLYALYQNNPHLEPAYVKRTLKYMDQFYETINKPSLVKTQFINQGLLNQNSYITIKGLN